MILADQIKILKRKIMQNEAQYDLDGVKYLHCLLITWTSMNI